MLHQGLKRSQPQPLDVRLHGMCTQRYTHHPLHPCLYYKGHLQCIPTWNRNDDSPLASTGRILQETTFPQWCSTLCSTQQTVVVYWERQRLSSLKSLLPLIEHLF